MVGMTYWRIRVGHSTLTQLVTYTAAATYRRHTSTTLTALLRVTVTLSSTQEPQTGTSELTTLLEPEPL